MFGGGTEICWGRKNFGDGAGSGGLKVGKCVRRRRRSLRFAKGSQSAVGHGRAGEVVVNFAEV